MKAVPVCTWPSSLLVLKARARVQQGRGNCSVGLEGAEGTQPAYTPAHRGFAPFVDHTRGQIDEDAFGGGQDLAQRHVGEAAETLFKGDELQKLPL